MNEVGDKTVGIMKLMVIWRLKYVIDNVFAADFDNQKHVLRI